MRFAPEKIAALVAREGQVVRVVVAEARGSTPRELGAEMLIWADGQEGTIGGGQLEYEATRRAQAQGIAGVRRAEGRYPLGPDLGQCCGGSVTLAFELYDADSLPKGTARAPGDAERAFVPQSAEPQEVWVWGAGHVGQALVRVLAPLHGFRITWVDTGVDRFPEGDWAEVTLLPTPEPARLMAHTPAGARHYIVTYSHALDLELCHAALQTQAGGIGLIGSQTKWTRFAKRLGEMGHGPEALERIACPIGDPSLGKEPQAIAVGVVAELLARQEARP